MNGAVTRDPLESPSMSPQASSDHSGSIPIVEGGLRCLVGPTAAGKSALALALCERAGAQLVSLDSMQVYRGMDLGTAKPTVEERERVPHHMLDLVEPNETYDVHRYLKDLRQLLAELGDPLPRLLFVGGTAFYLKVLVAGLFEGPPTDHALRKEIHARLDAEGNQSLHDELTRIDPVAAARIHANDSKRLVRALEVYEQTGKPLSEWQKQWGWDEDSEASEPQSPHRLIGVDLPPQDLEQRIAARITEMIDAGWVEEVRRIRDTTGFGSTSIQALGYPQVLDLAEERITRTQCEELVTIKTRQFARRQRTWYKKFAIDWLYSSERGVSEHHVNDALRLLGWED